MQKVATTTLPTIAEIVRNDYRTADVFKKWGLNFCCGGNVPLADACEIKKIDHAAIEAELKAATNSVNLPNAVQFTHWPVSFLADYITYVHHGYIKQVLSPLQQHIASFVSGHQKKYPYLAAVKETFTALADEITGHMQNEEENVFPYVKQIVNVWEGTASRSSLLLQALVQPLLETLSTDRRQISGLLLVLREQTNHYQFAENACTNHQVIYHKLKEFDADLQQHQHLENNILYPRVLEMESVLLH